MAPRIRRRITTAKREEIEKQQKALSQAIVRPFEVLSGLPVSYNPPPNGHYENVLKNPLTTKDTGVLYRSLMKSRLNYMNIGPMFKLYWLKQSSYAKKMQQLDQEKNTYKAHKDDKSSERVPILGNDVSARDVMVKLCDASLSFGPHKFEIRLFIAKDERSEKNGKKKDEEDKVKKEPNSKEELDGKESAISTNKTADSINENANIKEKSVESNLSKSTEEQKYQSQETPINEESLKEENSNEPKDNIPTSVQSAQSITNETQKVPNETSDSNLERKTNSTDRPQKDQDKQKTKPTPNEKSETMSSKEGENDFKKKVTSKVNSKEIDNKEDQNENSQNISNIHEGDSKTLKNSTTTSNVENINTSSNPQTATLVQQPSTGNSSTMNQSSVSTPQNPSPTPPDAPSTKTDPNSMQSIENTIMIANLNTIARVDQSLNALMKIVALGNASPQQIITFQGYIQRAREMGPQPHHAYLFPNGILPNQRPRKLQRDKKPPKEKKPPKPKVPKDQKLTAFQEKYITDATLLFEFVENANVRYMLPQEAICEVLPPATFDPEEPDNKDILVSFLWIHNQNEVDNYNQKLSEYNEFKKKEEEELNKDKLKKEEDLKRLNQNEEGENNEPQKNENQQAENEQKPEHALENEESRSGEQKLGNEDKTKEVDSENQKNDEELLSKPSRRPPPRKGRRRRGGPVPNKKVAPKKIECPVEPEIKYTALSFTIHGIPSRYVPIIVNSFKKLEEVQERMSYILKNGTRTTSFYLWYQVDGKLDESIAEDVRVQLNQEEKKMQGVTSTQSSTSNSTAKKRKQKEKGTEPKSKKNKTDPTVSITAPVSTAAPILDSTQVPAPVSAPTPTQAQNQNG